MLRRGNFFNAALAVLTGNVNQPLAEEPVKNQIMIHSNALPKPPISYTERYCNLQRENSTNKIPQVLLDPITEEPLEQFAVTGLSTSHAFNVTSLNCIDPLIQIDPTTRETVVPIPKLDHSFKDTEASLLLVALNLTKANKRDKDKLAKIDKLLDKIINPTKGIAETFDVAELLVIRTAVLEAQKVSEFVNGESAQHLIQLLGFHVRVMLTNELKKERNLFFNSLETIKTLKENLADAQAPIEYADMPVAEIIFLEKARLEAVIDIKLSLISALAEFIKNTKALILRHPRDEKNPQAEINTVLEEDFNFLLQQISEFKDLQRKVGIELNLDEYDVSINLCKTLKVYVDPRSVLQPSRNPAQFFWLKPQVQINHDVANACIAHLSSKKPS